MRKQINKNNFKNVNMAGRKLLKNFFYTSLFLGFFHREVFHQGLFLEGHYIKKNVGSRFRYFGGMHGLHGLRRIAGKVSLKFIYYIFLKHILSS